MKMLICFLAVIGAFALLVVAFLVLEYVYDSIKLLIRDLKRRHQLKRRFNKPPTAKCYCIDCIHHNPENNACASFKGWYTADVWFCWKAEPRHNFVD